MSVDFSTTGPPISEADIDAFEARVGRRLPSDYRTFLLQHNGGQPRHHVIRNAAIGDVGVQLFFGICDREYLDIDVENQSMRGRWPERFLSIGCGDCGDSFLLSLGQPDDGSVYFWDHEQEAEAGEEPTESNLHHLGSSFTEFWERIEPIDRHAYLAEHDFSADEQPRPADSWPPTETNGEAT